MNAIHAALTVSFEGRIQVTLPPLPPQGPSGRRGSARYNVMRCTPSDL